MNRIQRLTAEDVEPEANMYTKSTLIVVFDDVSSEVPFHIHFSTVAVP